MQRGEVPLRERLLAVGEEFLAVLRRDPSWTRVVIREALRAAPDGDGSPVRGALVSLATDRTRALAAALREEVDAGRIRPCDPRRVAEHLFHALIGHFVASAIAGRASAPKTGADPFLVHLVDTIAAPLERSVPREAPARRRKGGRTP